MGFDVHSKCSLGPISEISEFNVKDLSDNLRHIANASRLLE